MKSFFFFFPSHLHVVLSTEKKGPISALCDPQRVLSNASNRLLERKTSQLTSGFLAKL